MKFDILRNRKYLVGFLCLMVLNCLLVIFLLNSILAQTSDKLPQDQSPIVIEIVKQENCPLLMTLMHTDSSDEKTHEINVSVQNVSSKKIRSFVLFHPNEFGSGGTSTLFFQAFVPGQVILSSFWEAKVNIKSNGKLYLSIDYVEFTDGSSWGKDTQKQSEYISGQLEGENSAINQVKQLVTANRTNELSNLLQKETEELNPPDIDNTKSSKWRSGLTAGYRSILIRLQSAYVKQGMEGVSFEIKEIEKLTKKDGQSLI